jgi:hypothetical protein
LDDSNESNLSEVDLYGADELNSKTSPEMQINQELNIRTQETIASMIQFQFKSAQSRKMVMEAK